MPDELSHLLQHTHLPPAHIALKSRQVYEQILGESRYLRRGNFEAIHNRDLEGLWRAYDALFFEEALRAALGDVPLRFRLSRRLTSAAGQTVRRTVRSGGERRGEYEISVSTTILFQTFLDVDRPVTASGIPCHDRLEALQRVFEHELIHLAEMLAWSDSSCTAPRFQSIANRLFGHREHTHQLITARERAWTRLGLRIGDRVTFQFDGRHYEGLLNRITRRATVLVQDPRGAPYADGNRYTKFYVPLSLLKPAAT
jgi:hypothetical protein